MNGIASFSFLDDRAVVHANLGAIRDRDMSRDRTTWGIGLEAQLVAPRLYGDPPQRFYSVGLRLLY